MAGTEVVNSEAYTEYLKTASFGHTEFTNMIWAKLVSEQVVRKNTDRWTMAMHLLTDEEHVKGVEK